MPRSRCSFLLLMVSTIFFAFSNGPAQDDLKRVIETLRAYLHFRPQEKLYLHLDKPFYAAGENLWFKAYLMDAVFHRKDSSSKVIYTELLNTHGDLILRHLLYARQGSAHGDFSLPDSLPQGKYIVRAYTNYMKNLGEDFFFIREIDVLNANGPRLTSGEIVSAIALQFFAEGGNLLAGVENRVAFKAIDEQGKGIFAEGDIVDENNVVVTSFKTEHNGMGVIKITPVSPQKQYKATLKKPEGADGFFPLPEIVAKGYILRVTEEDDNIKVIAYTNVKSFSSAPCFISLVAQSRGVVTFAARGEIAGTTYIKKIPKGQFPTGITQITLFDGATIPQCERLIFVDHHDALKLSATTDQPGYSKRSKASLDIVVLDKDGAPVSGDFSLSVYDENKVKDQDRYPLSIANYLVLTSDLAGNIETPGYYLKDDLPETKHHRDLLMLTHGWRRFTWKTILEDSVWAEPYHKEKGIPVSGHVLRSLGKKPAAGGRIKVLTTNGDILVMAADSLGRFFSDHLLYYDSVDMVVQTDNARGKQTELQLFLNPFTPSPVLKHTSFPFYAIDASEFLTQAGRQNRVMDALDGKAAMLKEVEISSTKIEESRSTLYGTPDQTIKMDNFTQGYSNIFQVLQGRVPGLYISGSPPGMSISIRGGGTPLFLVDGMPMDAETVSTISPTDVESIDVVKGAGAAVFGSQGGNGVIAINTRKGFSGNSAAVGIHRIRYPGFYRAREFYVPQYDIPSDNHNLPDLRSTLYWNPSIQVDSTGKTHISFYTSDVSGSYKIVLEGISDDGVPGYGEGKLKIK